MEINWDEVCVFCSEANKRCQIGSPVICNAAFRDQCDLFELHMGNEKREFQGRRTVWNREKDGKRGIYHGTML